LTATTAVAGVARHPDEARVGRRAAASLVALLVAALTSIGFVLAHSIQQQEQSRVVGHLGVALQAALSEASREAGDAQQRVAMLAAEPRLQRALAAGDEKALARLTSSVPGASAVPGSQGVPETSRSALRRELHVLTKGKVIGTVSVTIPLDGAALARLRDAAPLAPGEGILFVRAGRVLAGPAGLSGARVPPHAQSVLLDGAEYRVVQTPLVGGPAPIRLAAFAPAAEIGRPVSRSERLLAACLAVTFVALLLLVRLLARPALVPLVRLARDARSSGTDDLSNLPNRRAFAEAAAAELVRARRSGRPLAVVLVDIDDFKRVNDTFGHSTGDRVLCGVADVLRDHFREIDLAARFGGDEFAVLLPETDVAGAREAAERFVTALSDREFGDGPSRPHGITVSAGVAAAANVEIDVLLEAADRALYRAKEHGKNQVQVEAVPGDAAGESPPGPPPVS
jgi:diguanylate cyclase (GGDEF)-like protein